MIAELEPRQPSTVNGSALPGLPIVEALDRFADEADGWFCRYEQLKQYARDRNFRLAGKTVGVSWPDYIAQAPKRRRARHARTRGLPPAGTWSHYPDVGEGGSGDAEQPMAASPELDAPPIMGPCGRRSKESS